MKKSKWIISINGMWLASISSAEIRLTPYGKEAFCFSDYEEAKRIARLLSLVTVEIEIVQYGEEIPDCPPSKLKCIHIPPIVYVPEEGLELKVTMDKEI